MDITAHKKILREKLIKQRNSIDRNDIVRASDKIYSKLISLDIINEAKTVMVYVSFASEVMTHEFIKYLINKKTQKCTILRYTQESSVFLLNNNSLLRDYFLSVPLSVDE